ncbi:MAG TPA: hypothetical protein PLP98_10905, partial [Plasticicumulans sp.]|nr:hypothetical protein [Plasticicumulans sp.]
DFAAAQLGQQFRINGAGMGQPDVYGIVTRVTINQRPDPGATGLRAGRVNPSRMTHQPRHPDRQRHPSRKKPKTVRNGAPGYSRATGLRQHDHESVPSVCPAYAQEKRLSGMMR